MPKIKVVFAVSAIAALVFWGVSLAGLRVQLLQGPGRPNVSVAAAATASIAALVFWLALRRDKREDEKLERDREELRKDREAVMRLAAAIVSRHDVPVQAARQLTVVQQSLTRESA